MFTMDELARCIPQQSPYHNQQINEPIDSDGAAYFNNLSVRRSVTFEEEDSSRGTSLTSTSQLISSNVKRNGLPEALRPLAEARLNTPAKDYARVKFLSICPREELTLNRINGENEIADVVVLKNESSKNVVYKIKITSPEKFRVRPSTGTIAAGATDFIRVYLQSEFRNSVPREKLLLMAVETSRESNENFGNVWKNASEEAKLEHKLKCRLSDEKDLTTLNEESVDSTANRSGNMFPANALALARRKFVGRISLSLNSSIYRVTQQSDKGGNTGEHTGGADDLSTKHHHDLDGIHHRASVAIPHLAASTLYINFKYSKRFLL
ncbi:unnamed protein product [Litomosoides sigmodontis]|uniref:Major sperm protein n=1 Tax=Litomosoides sigmodontis TaxID=42156 RepID=A0A3P6TDP4_LITSI|nr:unnamed protein product [Litomosoides sigmodontis]